MSGINSFFNLSVSVKLFTLVLQIFSCLDLEDLCLKDELQNLIASKIEEIETKEINQKLEKEKIDITLPERPVPQGKIHPVSQVIDEISSIFSEIGFSYYV